MPRSEKWLVELDVHRSTLQVADEILRRRLKAMNRLLKKVLEAGEDVEAVHDVRVGSRRAEAALLHFKPLLPRKRCQRLRKRLQRLRRAAGAVRDCDVHWKHLNDETNPNRVLLKEVKHERQQASRALQQVLQRMSRKRGLKKQTRKVIKKLSATKLQEDTGREFASFARRSLGEQADSFFQLATVADSGDEAWHQLRIAAKRWRYTLELAAGACAKPWSGELYDALREIQDRLGEAHDVETLCNRIKSCLKAPSSKPAELQEVWEQQRERLAQLRGELGRWWTAERREQLRDLWRRASGHAEDQPQTTR